MHTFTYGRNACNPSTAYWQLPSVLSTSPSTTTTEINCSTHRLLGGPHVDGLRSRMKTSGIVDGRWFSSLLGDLSSNCLDQRSISLGLQRLQKLTGLFQVAQWDLYRVRYIELSSKEAHLRRQAIANLRWKRKTYTQPRLSFRHETVHLTEPSKKITRFPDWCFPASLLSLNPPPAQQQLLTQSGVWKQYSTPRSSAKRPLYTTLTARPRKFKTNKRE